MKDFRQWINETKAEIPADVDYFRLFSKWQCREERKGEWYFPFTKSNALVNSNSDRRANDEVLNVYDLEKDDWRAFRIDNVHTIEACVFDG